MRVRIPSAPLMRNIMFKASWNDYEECHSVVIWEQNGNYFLRIRGHNVMIGDYYEKIRITSEEAIKIMIEEIEYEDTDYLNLSFQEN